MDRQTRNTPLISILLPTFNRRNIIPRVVLPSLEKQDFLNYELIVVDDGSTDGTKEFFRSAEFAEEFPNGHKRAKYIRNERNLGLPASRNIGVANSSGEWIQMVEDDLELVGTEFLSTLAQMLETSDRRTIYVPRLITKRQVYYEPKEDEIVREGKLTKHLYVNFESRKAGYIISGHACSIIPRQCFDHIQYDSQSFRGNYFREETDFYESAKKNGYGLLFTPDLVLTHHNYMMQGGCQSTQSLAKLEYYHLINHYRYLRKHYKYAPLRFALFMMIREMNNIKRLVGGARSLDKGSNV